MHSSECGYVKQSIIEKRMGEWLMLYSVLYKDQAIYHLLPVQTASSWQEGISNSNNHLLQPRLHMSIDGLQQQQAETEAEEKN